MGLLGRRSFIGGALERHLLGAGVSVVGASSQDCDLLDEHSTRRFVASLPPGGRLVVCATINKHVDDSFAAFVKNTRMIEHVVIAAADAELGGVVFLSSVDVYGLTPAVPITERTVPAPARYYGAAKLACEALLKRPGALRCPVTVLRLPGVYGAGDGGRSVVGGLLARLLEGLPITVRGGGAVRRDYVHVDDVCAVIAAVLDLRLDGVLNVATGESRPIRDIVDVLADAAGVTPRVIEGPGDPGGTGDLVFDTTAFRAAVPRARMRGLPAGARDWVGAHRAHSMKTAGIGP